MDGFRPGGSLMFDRLPDGSVVIARLERTGNNKERVRFSHIITPDVWAELIAYVSTDGHPTNDQYFSVRNLDNPTGESPEGVIESKITYLAEAFHAGNIEQYKNKPPTHKVQLKE